jgi:hypothetical protein
LCASKGSPYAGMEYGDEVRFLSAGYASGTLIMRMQCHCGSGYVGGQPPASAPPSDCNMLCAGDATQVCGAGWRMQVYVYSGTFAASTTASPAAPASPTPRPPPTITPTLLPTGWNTDFACAVDTPDRILSHVQTYANASLTPASCIALCLSKDPRYAYVGVECGDEVRCFHSAHTPVPTCLPSRQVSLRDGLCRRPSSRERTDDGLQHALRGRRCAVVRRRLAPAGLHRERDAARRCTVPAG